MTHTVTAKRAALVLDLVAQWLGQHGCGEITCKEGRTLTYALNHKDDGSTCEAWVLGPAPTGKDAAYRGEGPMLVPDWDWPSQPTPTVILEGGPYEWAYDCVFDVQAALDAKRVPVRVEPYACYALCIYPN